MTDAPQSKPTQNAIDTFDLTLQSVISVSAIALAAFGMILAILGIEPTFELGIEAAGVGALCGAALASFFLATPVG
jgi:hypothetical protein